MQVGCVAVFKYRGRRNFQKRSLQMFFFFFLIAPLQSSNTVNLTKTRRSVRLKAKASDLQENIVTIATVPHSRGTFDGAPRLAQHMLTHVASRFF